MGHESTASFAARWQRRGFAGVPPHAALVIDAAPSGGDIAVVELMSRRLLSAKVIRYRAHTRARPGATSPLARFARGADRRVVRNVARASLYVDPSTGSFVSLSLTIPALGAGQRAQLVFTDSAQVGSSGTSLGGPRSVITALNAYLLFAGAAIPSTSPTIGSPTQGHDLGHRDAARRHLADVTG